MDIRELREQTKALFKESGAHPYLAVLGLYILIYAVNFVLNGISVLFNINASKSALSLILLIIIYMLSVFFSMWAELSLSWYYLRITRKEKPGDSFNMAFHALPGFISYALIYSVAIGVIFIFIPFAVIMLLNAMGANLALIAILVGIIIIGVIYAGLLLAFNTFCYYDRGKKTIMQTLKMNFEVTKGHKTQILKVMLVYFLPFFVVYAMAICCFVGLAYAINIQYDGYMFLLGVACIMMFAFVLAAIYFVWALPNLSTNLCIMYNSIVGYKSETELGDKEMLPEITEE